ncbi:unnamed protein product, partial [Meganyctiphanes norvegica]
MLSNVYILQKIRCSVPRPLAVEGSLAGLEGQTGSLLRCETSSVRTLHFESVSEQYKSVNKMVRDVMHKAFWDQLKEQLEEEPIVYTQAFVLLQEVRDNLTDITLPQHTRLRQEIAEAMDLDLIKQQAEHGVLDFTQYSQYVLSIMARLCAPVRDETIQGLMKETSVLKVFRGVMETLDLMRLDMANFTIQQIRPHIIAQSVDYEKKKFDEFLKTQNDGLELTREWLLKHITQEDLAVEDDMEKRKVITAIINKSYLELLSWPEETLLPETVVLDESRVLELRDRLTQVCILGSILLVTLSSVGPLIHTPDAFKSKLKRNLCIILDPALSDKDTLDLMDNLAEQVVKDVEDYLSENEKPPLPVSAKTALKSQVLEIKNPDQRIRALIKKRALEFIGILMASTTAKPVQMPPGLSTLQEELAQICGTLLRLVSHNRAVFGDYYADIILGQMKAHHEMVNSPTK